MKKFILALVAILATITMSAQQTTVEGTKLFNNTSVTVYGGPMGWVNPAVSNSDTFFEGIRPSVGVALDKWITPAVGVGVFYETSVNSFPFNSTTPRWTVFDMHNLGFNGELNLNNLFHGYKGLPDRVEVVPYVGMGWAHGYTNYPGSNISTPEYSYGDHTSNYISANMGESINFNMGKERAWQINLRLGVSYMLAGEGMPVQFNSQRMYLSLQPGLTWKIPYKNSVGKKTHNFTIAYPESVYNNLLDEYNALNKKYQEKPKEVERIVEKVVDHEVPVETVVVEKTIPSPHFVQNLAIVDATSVAYLDILAEEINASEGDYTIHGYASLEGSEEYNTNLSLKRANAIRQCLIDRGVDDDRLTAVGHGATDQFGPTYEANRVVVIEKN